MHPAFVLRNLKAYRARFTEDIQKVKDELDGKLPTHIPFRKHEASWQEILDVVKGEKIYGIDVETNSLHRFQPHDIVGIGVCNTPGESLYYPFADVHESITGMRELKPYLESDHARVASNKKFEMHKLLQYGITLGPCYDTYLAAWLLGDMPLALKDAILSVFGIEMIRINTLIGDDGDKKIGDVQRENRQAVVEYASQDADASLRLHSYQLGLLKSRGLWKVYHAIELPYTPIVVEMERTGMGFDRRRLGAARTRLDAHYKGLEKRTNELIGLQGCYYCRCEAEAHKKTVCGGCANVTPEDKPVRKHKYGGFNPKSSKQSAEVLYDRVHKYTIKPRFSSRDTNKTTLGEHLDNELVRLILEARATWKMKGTYVDGLPKHVQPDGRIYCTINQPGTDTGRISAADPNLTNIPARDREDVSLPVRGKDIRKAFVPQEGCVIAAPDLSGIEFRVEAHLSGDESLIQTFLDGGDPHSEHAEAIYELRKDQVDPDEWANMRYTGKMVGFGVLFGLTPQGLILRTPSLGLTPQQAQLFINRFFDRRPGIRKHQEEIIRFGTENGYVETLTGRRRWLPDLTSSEDKRRKAAERMAVNFPVQGSAADIFKTGQINAWKVRNALRMRTRFLIPVHDELVMETPREELDLVATKLVPELEHAIPIAVPTPVDMEWGESWGELQVYEYEHIS